MRWFAACAESDSHAIDLELRSRSEAPAPTHPDNDDIELTFVRLRRGERGGKVSLGQEVTEYPGPSGETSGGRDGWVRSAHLKRQEAVASLRKGPSMVL